MNARHRALSPAELGAYTLLPAECWRCSAPAVEGRASCELHGAEADARGDELRRAAEADAHSENFDRARGAQKGA